MRPIELASCRKGIIEGDQIEVADFYLASFAHLTALVTDNHNADSNQTMLLAYWLYVIWRYYCQRYDWL